MPVLQFPRLSFACLPLLLCSCGLTPTNGALEGDAGQLPQQVAGWSQAVADPPAGAQKVDYLNRLIQSPQLDRLLHEALSANPDLQQTLITLRIRRAEARASGAARLPGADLGLASSGARESDSSHTGSLTVTWEADLWQKLGDEAGAADTDAEEQAALYQSARDALAAQVMKDWLGLTARQNAVHIQQQRVASLEKSQQLVLQRFSSGLDSASELDSARSALESARATLEENRESLAQLQRSLKTLLGRSGGDTPVAADNYPAVLLPLAALPEQTLQRRPDLRAAYLSIRAASQRSAAAYKALLPSISIRAALEDAADSPSEALLTDPLWSLLGQLSAPLYRGGQLRAQAEASDLKIAHAYQGYRDTLLTAVEEVENALGQERSLAQQQAHLEKALASARNSLAQYRRSYRSGLVDILDLLQVERTTYDLQTQLDQLIYQRLSNRVDLGLALGLGIEVESNV
ncbi:TolC family protein [Microbulbifer taiwanensis]|uniref:TolC family protein n=1 Tax=Microbulbifer taiwanensis TaxID=986746 RepID=A0ABW1YL51_9GAMM|nr:TolC family protein [Microbulbifer taiwanensis]